MSSSSLMVMTSLHGAAAALTEASGEQVALGAATLAGEPVPTAGAFVDAAGRV